MNLITIDGHSGSGKGTLAKSLSQQLHWHYLDSGALYRVVVYLAEKKQLIDHEANLIDGIEPVCNMIANTPIQFKDEAIYVGIGNTENINPFIRNEIIGKKASILSLIHI